MTWGDLSDLVKSIASYAFEHRIRRYIFAYFVIYFRADKFNVKKKVFPPSNRPCPAVII